MTRIALAYPPPLAAQTAHTSPSLFALSMWIRAIFIGASLFVAGLVSVAPGMSANTTSMLALAAAGLALAAVALLRTQAILRCYGAVPAR